MRNHTYWVKMSNISKCSVQKTASCCCRYNFVVGWIWFPGMGDYKLSLSFGLGLSECHCHFWLQTIGCRIFLICTFLIWMCFKWVCFRLFSNTSGPVEKHLSPLNHCPVFLFLSLFLPPPMIYLPWKDSTSSLRRTLAFPLALFLCTQIPFPLPGLDPATWIDVDLRQLVLAHLAQVWVDLAGRQGLTAGQGNKYPLIARPKLPQWIQQVAQWCSFITT